MISAIVQYRNQLQIPKIQIQIQVQTKKLNSQTGVGDKYGDYWETPPPLPLLSRLFFFCDDHGDNHDDLYHGDNHDDHDDIFDVLCDNRDNDPGEDFHDY